MTYKSWPGHNSPGLHYFEGQGLSLSFQDGPIPEHGVNGTTNEEIIQLLVDRIHSLNEMFPCKENAVAITHLETALAWLNLRTKRRQERGVEGTMMP